MTSTHPFLEIMHKLGTESKIVTKVFRRSLDLRLFIAAYTELARNKGSLTAGNNGETIDGSSIEKLEELIRTLRNKEFRWTSVKRIYVPKSNGKKRPLGIPDWQDRVVQMVLKMVLESYYEPQFLDNSHGFRPQRGCHTALLQIKQSWSGMKWFIEGDIEGCFDNISHELILKLIGRQIKDNQILSLIKQMLQAGYMEDWQYHKSYSGTPQGGILSPLLANIVLHELDNYITETLIPKYTYGKKRDRTDAYNAKVSLITYHSSRGNVERARTERKKLRHMQSGNPMDRSFKRLKYIRYADDFMLGFIGSKEEAENIKTELKNWLNTELGLKLSAEKTKVTHAQQERARFLGYEIGVIMSDRMIVQTSKNGIRHKKRNLNGQIQLYVPQDVREKWVNKYLVKGKPIHRSIYLGYSDYEIIHAYGSEWRGLVNYYNLAMNIHSLRIVEWTMLQSLTATLAGKHKSIRSKIREKYETTVNGKKSIVCEVANPKNPMKPFRAIMGGIPLKREDKPTLNVDKLIWKPKYGRTELTQRLLAHECELCGSTEHIEVHHIRSIRELKQRYKKQEAPLWVVHMAARHRNTLVVCRSCHDEIHAGKYDKNKVLSK
jgi:group II intron reverse transcriptase/maturase